MYGIAEDRSLPKPGTRLTVDDVETPLLRRSASTSPSRAMSPNEPIVSQHEQRSLVRGLSQRHVQMIAIAGAIVRAATYPLPTQPS